MALTAKAKRRITLVLVLVLVVTGGVAGLYAYQTSRKQQQYQQMRDQGLAAFEQQDYAQALEKLSAYHRERDGSAETLYAYGRSRLEIPREDHQHLVEAMHVLERTVDRDPTHRKAAHDLLDLYRRLGRDNKALHLADSVLLRDEQNAHALYVRATALARLDQIGPALEAARAAIESDPDYWRAYMVLFPLRAQQGEAPAQLLEEAVELHAQHEGDPRYELLLGYAYGLMGNREQTVHWLRTAAEGTPPNDEFLQILVRFLDNASLYEEATQLLAEHVERDRQPGLYLEAMQRLFEAGDVGRLAERLADIDPVAESLSGSTISLTALRAMALYQLGRSEEADAIVDALASHDGLPLAQSWASVLTAVHQSEQSQSGRVLKACEAALQTFPDNAYFHAFRASAYATVGELEMARTQWQRAADLRPNWSVPRTRLATLLLREGEPRAALDYARAGLMRRPNDIEAATVLARALIDTLNLDDADQVERLLTLLEQIRERSPANMEALRLHVAVLGRTGQRDAAAQLVRDVLDREEKIDRGTLTALAALSERHDLGTAEACRQRLEAASSPLAEAVLRQSLEMARNGDAEAGLALIEEQLTQRTQDEGGAAALPWRLARAEYLARTGDAQAADAWIELADAQPDNPQLQQRALQVDGVRDDREFTQRAVQRLADTLGEQSLTWRVERARWLLTGPSEQRDPGQAANLLEQAVSQAPDQLEPRLLLANAHEQRGLMPLAVRELRAAAELQPNSVTIALELARLHQSLRHFRNARQRLEEVVDHDEATPVQLRRAAVMLARQGEDRLALNVLEQLEGEPRLDASDELLLAHLYRRTGQPDRVDALCQSLLANPTIEVIRFAADFYASRGQTDKAQDALARRDALDVSPARQALLLAQHASVHGSAEEALAHYREAVELAPREAALWHALVAFHLSQGDREAAIAAADEGQQRVPENAALRAFTEQAELIAELNAGVAVNAILAALMNEPEHREAVAEALRVLATAQQEDDAPAAVAREVASLADQYPQFLALQNLAARLHLAAGRPDAAVQMAQRAMGTFPRAEEPAWLATQGLSAMGQWREARNAAEQWRQRAGDATLPADLAIAESALRLNRHSAALQALEPYLDQAERQPDEHAGVLMRYARGLLADGRSSEAAELLQPLLDRSAAWRARWMRLAATAVSERTIAEAWLNRAASHIAPDATTELLALAENWWLLATRTGAPAYRIRAREILDELVQRSDAPATVWSQRGALAEQEGDLRVAEASYREALRRDASLHSARNNLAMVLITKEQPQPDEAVQHARQVVEAVPGSANYLDTLAQTQAHAGQCEQAIETMQRVLHMQPDVEMWREHLAEILAMCGQEDRAPELLDELAVQ